MATLWTEQLEKLLLFSAIEDPDNIPRAKFEAFAARVGAGVSGNGARSVNFSSLLSFFALVFFVLLLSAPVILCHLQIPPLSRHS